jgi:hypothetical protein
VLQVLSLTRGSPKREKLHSIVGVVFFGQAKPAPRWYLDLLLYLVSAFPDVKSQRALRKCNCLPMQAFTFSKKPIVILYCFPIPFFNCFKNKTCTDFKPCKDLGAGGFEFYENGPVLHSASLGTYYHKHNINSKNTFSQIFLKTNFTK